MGHDLVAPVFISQLQRAGRAFGQLSFVPVGPAKLSPEVGSDAPILAVGRPRSVMSRSSTVSDCSSPEADRHLEAISGGPVTR
jgi:hypothetical protein